MLPRDSALQSQVCDEVSNSDIDAQVGLYREDYTADKKLFDDAKSLDLLKIEARLKRFMEDKDCRAFTNCFENLTGLTGLPGLATQRLS